MLKATATHISAPPKTNGDRIRQMTDEELAEIVRFEDCSGQHYECPGWKQNHNCDCKECFLIWLKQGASEDE